MIELLIAFIGGGALTAIIKGTFDVIKARMSQKKVFPDTIRRMKEIYRLMDEVKATTGCDRVLILKAKNGGGVPRPGNQLYVSILYETYDGETTSVMDWWQNRRVDESYIRTLASMEEDHPACQTKIITKNMPKGILKDTYLAAEIEGSIVTKIVEKDNKYYFMSCNFSDSSKMTLAASVHMRNCAARIKELI